MNQGGQGDGDGCQKDQDANGANDGCFQKFLLSEFLLILVPAGLIFCWLGFEDFVQLLAEGVFILRVVVITVLD